ncbi:hypothetical protein EAE96_005859 [Botrytis aclada]|nr:hypothetical protein EAE96_005859 [Botrytis aclada]
MTPLVSQRAEAIDASTIPTSVLAGIGALPPPPGMTPNFADPDSIQPVIWGFCAFGFFTIAICIMVRLWVIFRLSHPIKWAWSDIGFTFAVLATIVTFIEILIGASGFGRTGIHSWDASLDKVLSLRSRTAIALNIIMPPLSICLIKIIIFLMYLELFATMKVIRKLCYVGMGVTTIFYFIIIVTGGVWAFPLSIYFVADNAIKAQALNLPKGAFDLVTDVYLFLVPMVAVSRLDMMTMRKKLGILLIFSTGFLAIISAAMNIYWRVYINTHSDHLWFATAINVVTITEHAIGLIIADTPHFARFFRRYRSRIGFYLCCRYAKKEKDSQGSKEFAKKSEGSTEDNAKQGSKSRKLYPGLDVTTVGGTLRGTVDNKTDEEAQTEQVSTEHHPAAQYLADTY